MPISPRALKRRQSKMRIETQLENAISARDAANAEKAQLCFELDKVNQSLLATYRELQTARRDLFSARAELNWIAQHAIAKTIGARNTFVGAPVESDCATTAETPSRV